MDTNYLANGQPNEGQIEAWAEEFNRRGCLFMRNILPPDWTAALRADLDHVLRENPNGLNNKSQRAHLAHRLFETSPANLRLFDMEPMISLAEAIIGPDCHVIHNNSFISPPGGGLDTWHQDDRPHYIITGGDPPTNVHLPVLFFTANFYLTDVTEIEHGGTEVIPGSHLFGASPPRQLDGTEWEERIQYNVGPAGSVVLFNNQVWHRGGPNRSQRTRYITQVTYARRIVGHKFYPFMNYNMPEHLYANANDRLRRLLGFLPHGAYG